MKQLIIAGNKPYATTGVKYEDLTTVGDGVVALFRLSDGAHITDRSKLNSNFAVVCGRGVNKMPIVFTEVDVNSLEVTKAEYRAGATFTGKITIPTPIVGKDYTVLIAKKGTIFNERNRWTFTCRAKNTTAANVASDIVKNINANTPKLGVKATNTGGAITITATEVGKDYEILGADELMGVAPTAVTSGKSAMLDKAYVQDLASRCAAGKGFDYTDNPEIYPGYPEIVAADTYTLYTLRFAVPRVYAKQRDEVVYQLLHIAVPTGAGMITTLDTIFGLSAPSTGD